MLCFVANLYSQQTTNLKLPAKGDKLPELLFDAIYNPVNKIKGLRVSDLKGKLVILDFWASWCSPCVKAFPKLDSLQRIFDGQLQIVLVNSMNTRDTDEKIRAVYEGWKNKTGKDINLPCVLQDTTATTLFPHQLLPHYVWIDKEGKYLAATSADDVNKATIQAVLNTVPVAFAEKKDQTTEQFLFSSPDLPVDRTKQYSVFMRGHYPGLPSGNRFREKNGIIHGRCITNSTLKEMYEAIVRELEKGLTGRQFLYEVNDSLNFFKPADEKTAEKWKQEHLYSMDVVVPVTKATQLYPVMLDYLNSYSGYRGELVTRKMKCLLLNHTGDSALLKTKGGKRIDRLRARDKPFMINSSIKTFVTFLNECDAVAVPVFDETGITYRVDMQFERVPKDIAELNELLKQYGLVLTPAECDIKVFVLKGPFK